MSVDETKAALIEGTVKSSPPPPLRGHFPHLLTTLLLAHPMGIAKLKAREEHIREAWVKAMEARIVRDSLSKCQKIEGVNHYEKCKDLAERYVGMLEENKVCASFSFYPPSTSSFSLRECMLTALDCQL